MKRNPLYSGFLIFLFLFSGCQKKVKDDSREDALILFDQSSELIVDIIDKIQFASDSLEIDSLQKFFEKKIIDINFSVPPETDFRLNEEENDSLFKLLQKMNHVITQKLEDFSVTYKDSIPEE